MTWLAAFVEGKREQEFEKKVNEEIEGYRAYVPLGKKKIKPRNARKFVEVTYPAFPNYVFVEMPCDWLRGELCKLWALPMLRYVLSADGSHLTIEDEVINSIMRMQESGLFDDLGQDKRDLLKAGSLVLIDKGHLFGRKGIVTLPNVGRNFALLSVDGMKAKINVDFLKLLRQSSSRTSQGDPSRPERWLSGDPAPEAAY